MEVRIHGSHMSVDDELRNLAEEKVVRAAKVFDDANFADVEFTEEHNPRLAAERFIALGQFFEGLHGPEIGRLGRNPPEESLEPILDPFGLLASALDDDRFRCIFKVRPGLF